jgi:hypothetical protein
MFPVPQGWSDDEAEVGEGAEGEGSAAAVAAAEAAEAAAKRLKPKKRPVDRWGFEL